MSEARAFYGAAAVSAVNAVKLALQLAVLPVMARLLGPPAFGLIAIAMPFILLSNLLCDAGMGAALVRQQDPSRELESTVFWLSVGVSVTLSLVVCAISFPLAAAFSQPTLVPVLAALSVILIISGGLSVVNAKIWRERNFGLFAVGDFLSALCSAAAGIAAALQGWGVWSLVTQQLVLWGVKALWLIPASGIRLSLCCRPRLARPFLAFGLHGIGADLAELAGKSLPAAAVGALLGIAAAGYYSLGYQVTRIPELVLSGPVYLATFSAIARTGEDKATAAEITLKGLRLLIVIAAPSFCGLAMIADIATRLVLGAKWAPSAPVIALLCPGAFMICVYTFCGAVLMGSGRSDKKLGLTVITALSAIAGCGIGSRYGVAGLAAGLSGAALVALPFYIKDVADELHLHPRQIATAVAGPLVATVSMAAVLAVARACTGALDDLTRLAVLVAVGILSCVAMLAAICGRQVVADLKQFLPTTRMGHGEPI